IMPLRSGNEHQATSSNSRARNGRPPRLPGLTIPKVPREDAHHEAVDAADGAATVRFTPDVYAHFQQFQNLPAGEWEQFQLFREFMQMRGQPAVVTPEAADERPAPPPAVQRAVQVVIPPGETQGRSFDSFLGARPPIEDIFKRIACAPEFKVSHATYQLEDAARFWWQGVERRFETRGVEPTWDDFVAEFERKYYTAHIVARKKIESRPRSVSLETNAEQMFHFERGMDPDLVVQVRGRRCTSLTDMVEQARRPEDAMISAVGTNEEVQGRVLLAAALALGKQVLEVLLSSSDSARSVRRDIPEDVLVMGLHLPVIPAGSRDTFHPCADRVDD
ncbi:hypothetical protein Dimus_025010, partial [Dionaea muscipula]